MSGDVQEGRVGRERLRFVVEKLQGGKMKGGRGRAGADWRG